MTSKHGSGASPGFPCPQCGSRIEISIESLLAISAVQCSSCGLELSIDPEQSAAALTALRRYSDQIDSIRREQDS